MPVKTYLWFWMRVLRLARVFPDDVIEGFAHKGTHGNHGAAGNFLEFREPLGISIETALYLLGLANHATSVAQ